MGNGGEEPSDNKPAPFRSNMLSCKMLNSQCSDIESVLFLAKIPGRKFKSVLSCLWTEKASIHCVEKKKKKKANRLFLQRYVLYMQLLERL